VSHTPARSPSPPPGGSSHDVPPMPSHSGPTSVPAPKADHHSSPLNIPSPTHLAPGHLPFTHTPSPLAYSPLGRTPSPGGGNSSSDSISSRETLPGLLDNALSPLKDKVLPPPPPSASTDGSQMSQRPVRPEIVIPSENERTADGGKCYLHLVKERLMGLYLSVYVYKGCEKLVQGECASAPKITFRAPSADMPQGVDKDYVTTGLAGGRVGNKGGMCVEPLRRSEPSSARAELNCSGISLKLADHSFLFVNAHLAAHTSRNAARVANIHKIKSELRLDCFLPKDDPKASADGESERTWNPSLRR
jgi:hypothetical protein